MSNEKTKGQDAIDKMDEALALMKKSVEELHTVVDDLRYGRISIVERNRNDDE